MADPKTVKKDKPTKQQTLHKLAAKRIPRTLNMIKNIGNLASYEPTEAQRKVIVETIQAAVSKMVNRLNAPPTEKVEQTSFTLPK